MEFERSIQHDGDNVLETPHIGSMQRATRGKHAEMLDELELDEAKAQRNPRF
jgi:hypothetical protein